jgi:indolepyruvate ferredoxin oxidoreductase, beta subunit
MRRKTLKYREEQHRIETWLGRILKAASVGDYGLALEITECQRLVKGYSDTFARGLKNYETIMAALDGLAAGKPRAEIVQRLREAALADEMGVKLREELARVQGG